jgi:hypothetical protein
VAQYEAGIGDFANPASQLGAVHEAHFHRAVGIERAYLFSSRRRTVGGWRLSQAIADQKRAKYHRENLGCHMNSLSEDGTYFQE